MAYGEAIDQGSRLVSSPDKKNITTEMGSCIVLVCCDTKNKVQIKQYELSKVPSNIGHEGPKSITLISSTFVQQQEWCVET